MPCVTGADGYTLWSRKICLPHLAQWQIVTRDIAQMQVCNGKFQGFWYVVGIGSHRCQFIYPRSSVSAASCGETSAEVS